MNKIILNSPGCTSSKLSFCKQVVDIVKAHPTYFGIRVPAGTDAYGNNATGDTTSLVALFNYAFATNPIGKMRVLINMNPSRTGTFIVAANGGAKENVPTLPVLSGTISWLSTWAQKVINDLRAAAIALGLDPTQVLEIEGANEIGFKGNQQALDWDGTQTTYAGLLAGQIPAQAYTTLLAIWTPVNLHGIPFVPQTFAGDATSIGGVVDAVAINEINSAIAAPNRAAYFALGNKLATNRYMDAPLLPYNSVAVQAQYDAKLQTQLARLATFGLPLIVSEFGLDRARAPRCVVANQVRQDGMIQAKASANISEAGFYCAINYTGQITTTDYKFAAFNNDGTVPTDQNSVLVAP